MLQYVQSMDHSQYGLTVCWTPARLCWTGRQLIRALISNGFQISWYDAYYDCLFSYILLPLFKCISNVSNILVIDFITYLFIMFIYMQKKSQ